MGRAAELARYRRTAEPLHRIPNHLLVTNNFAAQSQIIHAAQNPNLEAGRPLSYEMILCRLGGWWTMEPNESSLQPLEIALLQLQ